MLLGSGTYTVNGAEVTKAEFLRTGGSIFYFAVPFLAAYLSAIAFALIKERPWSRPLLLGYCPMIELLVVFTLWTQKAADYRADTRFSLIEFVIASLMARWYLYRTRAVVAYYRALQGGEPSKQT